MSSSDKPIEMRFGAEVLAARKKMDLSLRELARKVGISHPYLSLIERGRVPPPAADKVTAIACELLEDPERWLAMASTEKGFGDAAAYFQALNTPWLDRHVELWEIPFLVGFILLMIAAFPHGVRLALWCIRWYVSYFASVVG